MKVFISWSGERSRSLAVALREWLPLVLQYIEPWVSDKDIAAGERWAQAIAGELESSNFGIICVTPENLNSEWVLFEAGALSKSMQDAKVIPLLFELENSDITGPLAQFQAQKVDQVGLTEIIQSINNVAENGAQNEIITQLVPAVWPKLENAIAEISGKKPSDKNTRTQREVLEELVTGVRGINSQIREFYHLADDRDPSYRKRRKRRFSPTMLDQMVHMSGLEDNALSWLVFAGLIREEFPWLSEILLEMYRDNKAGNIESQIQLRHAIHFLLRGPFIEETMGGSREEHMMAMEIRRVIDKIIDRPIRDFSAERWPKDEGSSYSE